MNQDVMDLPEVLERVQNDHDLLLELVDIFLKDCPEKIKALNEAVQTKNFETLKEVSHSLKGASGNLSAKKIYETCLTIEQKTKNHNLDGIEEILMKLDRQINDLKVFYGQLKVEFKKA